MTEWERQVLGLGLSSETAGLLGVIFLLALLVLVVLWILLPFAIFGIKDRLDRANEINTRILNQLEKLNNSDRLVEGEGEDFKLCPKCHQENDTGQKSCAHCGARF